MANLLQTPSLWPTLETYWNGTDYIVSLSPTVQNFALSGYTTQAGDTIDAMWMWSGAGFASLQVLVNGSAIEDIFGGTSASINNGTPVEVTWNLPSGATNVVLAWHCGSGTGTLTSTPPALPPVAANASTSIAANSSNQLMPTSFTRSGSPITPDSVTIVAQASNGEAIVTGTSVYYTPNNGFNGSDSFTYDGTYEAQTSNTATISVFVQPIPTPAEVRLRWTDDGGHNWSNFMGAPMGAIGQTANRVIFRRLGSTRDSTGLDRVFEISSDAYTQTCLVGASFLDA